MPYSVMIWLVKAARSPERSGDPGRNATTPVLAPGAAFRGDGAPAFDRLNYGFYENESEAKAALKELAKDLEKNAPVKVKSGSRTFLIPASRGSTTPSRGTRSPGPRRAGARLRGGRQRPRHGGRLSRPPKSLSTRRTICPRTTPVT